MNSVLLFTLLVVAATMVASGYRTEKRYKVSSQLSSEKIFKIMLSFTLTLKLPFLVTCFKKWFFMPSFESIIPAII